MFLLIIVIMGFWVRQFVGRVMIASAMIGSLAYANEQNEMSRSLDEMKELEPPKKGGHIGLRLGLSPSCRGPGIGWRLPLGSEQGANDFALYPNISFGLLSKQKGVRISPTLQYVYIAYKPDSLDLNTKKYIGYGLGILFNSPLFPIIPNPKISWGKEFDNGHFSEWSVNILPAGFAVVSFVAGAVYPNNELASVAGLGGLLFAFEYHHGF